MKIQRGFTLIELLVVIAIIGLLSSVVLASLNTARTKANNAQRLSELRQFTTALEFYYDANGQYPQGGPGCLGQANPCWNGAYSVLTTINAALAPYIGSVTPAPISPYGGFLYIVCPYTGVCTQNGYAILYFLDGSTSCGPGTVFATNGFGQTYCIMTR